MYPCKWEFVNVCKHTLCMFCSHCADLSTVRIPCAQTQILCRNIMCDLPYPHITIVMIMMIMCSTVISQVPQPTSKSKWVIIWLYSCAQNGDLTYPPPAHVCHPDRHATIRQIDLLVHLPRIFWSGRDWTFGILKNTLNFVNTNIFKYYYKNLLNIGENVPVADFGHYADYCAQLIPLSLLKSTLGGGDGARVMLHQICISSPMVQHTTWHLYNCTIVLHCSKLPLC